MYFLVSSSVSLTQAVSRVSFATSNLLSHIALMEKIVIVQERPVSSDSLELPPYSRMVSRLSNQHPNLVRLAQHLQQPSVDCNAAVIEFGHGSCETKRLYKQDQIEQVLATETSSLGRLFLVQGLSTGSIEMLGAHFNIDPNFFARQMQSGILYESNGMRDIPLLASHPTARESFCIRYHELRQFKDGISSWELQIMDQPRRVSVSRFNGEFDGVGIVRKNVSLWYRARTEGKRWDGRCFPQFVR
jgi:hypothetical protein